MNPRISFIVMGIVLLLIVFGVVESCNIVGPGHVGIIVNMTGTQKGVSDFPTTTGWTFVNPLTQRVLVYPTYVQTAKWTASLNEGKAVNEEISFNTVEGLVVKSDISFSYSLNPDNVPHFYMKFRTDDLETFTHGFLRNIARDGFNEVGSKMKVDEIYGSGKTELISHVRKYVEDRIAEFGVHVEQFGFIGDLRLPEQVVGALNTKIAAIQQASAAQNKVVQAQAEAQQKIALAQGEAQANALLARSISKELIEWRQLEILDKHWNGQYPQVVGGNALINLPLLSK